MCIRDRGHAARGALEDDQEAAGSGPHHQIPGPHALGGLEPVSYTHLRAHETVLDLVCRLLLEKKQDKKKTKKKNK